MYSNNEEHHSLVIIFAYAPPKESLKEAFWNKLQDYILNQQHPCMVMGDLNEIQNNQEKRVPTHLPKANSRDFWVSRINVTFLTSPHKEMNSLGENDNWMKTISMKNLTEY